MDPEWDGNEVEWGLEVQTACPECGTICDPGDRCEVCGKLVH